MAETVATALPDAPSPSPPADPLPDRRRAGALRGWGAWLGVAALVVAVSVAFVALTGMRPGYDAFGWLVWGRQAIHWKLNTDGAPSWKPLTFLFTWPYALAGRAQMSLWMVTAVAGALAAPVFAGRIAFRLAAGSSAGSGAGSGSGPGFAPAAAAVFAGVGILGITGYWHQILIANSDPFILALCLAAIDAHLAGRHRSAFALLVLASLGRPEVWAFAGLYALWLWRSGALGTRVLAAAAALLIPALWFVVPGLTSRSWLIAADLAQGTKFVIHGDVVSGVLGRFLGLYELPMGLAALAALGIAAARRARPPLALAAAACLWVVIEMVLAWRGSPAAPRFLIEPAAVMVVLAAGGLGWLLAAAPSRGWLRWAGPMAALALVTAFVPVVRGRARIVGAGIVKARQTGEQVDRLAAVIDREGGPAQILLCGSPVTLVGYQSALAWDLGLNVGEVGYKPGRAIARDRRIVEFKPDAPGWEVRAFNPPRRLAVRCDHLRLDTAPGPGPGVLLLARLRSGAPQV